MLRCTVRYQGEFILPLYRLLSGSVNTHFTLHSLWQRRKKGLERSQLLMQSVTLVPHYQYVKTRIFLPEHEFTLRSPQDDLGDRLTAAGVNILSIYGTTEVRPIAFSIAGIFQSSYTDWRPPQL